MNKEQLRNDLDQTLAEFHHLLAGIPDQKVNTEPFAGSWTPGQLARHVVLVNTGFLQLLNGNVIETSRPPDAAVEKLREVLLDFTAKRQAPERVVPPVLEYKRERLLDSLQTTREGFSEVINNLDLTQTAIDFEVPMLGHVTRWEALHFILYHTQRHIHQLKRMIEALEKQPVNTALDMDNMASLN